jgi:pseudouridine-5'-phosphate glycosidase
MHDLLSIRDDVKAALQAQEPVVALESTVISHGLPYPVNLETALNVEDLVRQRGAVPATIGVRRGRPCIGLSPEDLEHFASAAGIRKVSRRDLPVVVAQELDGATTVAATATLAAWAGIQVFATGGIGGVHRGTPLDVSNDLPTLAAVPVAVVCAGAKAILDLRATLEWLETAGVPVVGYASERFPAFYSRDSGLSVDVRVDTPVQAADLIDASRRMSLPGGILITVPVPEQSAIEPDQLEAAIERSLATARSKGIRGNAMTPFLLREVSHETGGASLAANVALLENNAKVAADIALALSRKAKAGDDGPRGPRVMKEKV